jgi:hypothetical protein
MNSEIFWGLEGLCMFDFAKCFHELINMNFMFLSTWIKRDRSSQRNKIRFFFCLASIFR